MIVARHTLRVMSSGALDVCDSSPFNLRFGFAPDGLPFLGGASAFAMPGSGGALDTLRAGGWGVVLGAALLAGGIGGARGAIGSALSAAAWHIALILAERSL